MALLENKFFDKNGNFDNKKIIALLKKAQKEQLKYDFGQTKKKA